jgi:hypothetical protein
MVPNQARHGDPGGNLWHCQTITPRRNFMKPDTHHLDNFEENKLRADALGDKVQGERANDSIVRAAKNADDEIKAAQETLEKARAKRDAALGLEREFADLLEQPAIVLRQIQAVEDKLKYFEEQLPIDDRTLRNMIVKSGVLVPPNFVDLLWRRQALFHCEWVKEDLITELVEAKKALINFANEHQLKVPREIAKTAKLYKMKVPPHDPEPEPAPAPEKGS